MVSKCASEFRREAGQDKVFLMKVNVFVYTGTCFVENWMFICLRNLRQPEHDRHYDSLYQGDSLRIVWEDGGVRFLLTRDKLGLNAALEI